MTPKDSSSAVHSFEGARLELTRLAYRMLGSVTDAEDVIQNAFIRWNKIDHTAVEQPVAYLRRIVTRLSLDALRTRKRRGEVYIGEWLPDPVVEEELQEDITMSLMLALERLSPLERAAFLLHDAFGLAFEEVAKVIDRTPAAARQLASRARINVQKESRRYKVDSVRGKMIATAFFQASRNGDMTALRAILGEDISLHADGGGQRSTVDGPVFGRDAVLQLQSRFSKDFLHSPSILLHVGTISGLPGFVTREGDGEIQTTAFDIEEGLIRAIYVVRNPDKLGHLKSKYERTEH